MTTMEAVFALQAGLEAAAGRLLKATTGGEPDEEGAEDGLQELVTEAAVALVEYKGLARESFMAVEECRDELRERKREVDERHLQLQNLLYEKDHLQRTILSLQDLPLAELSKIAREEGRGDEEGPLLRGVAEGEHDLVPAEEHRANLQLLQEARDRRKALHEEVAAAQSQKQARQKELQRLREALGVGMPRQIAELDAVCKGIREKHPELPVALPFAGVDPGDLRLLPQPLYQLLGRLLAYCQAVDPERRRLRASLITPQQDAAAFPSALVLGGGSGGNARAGSEGMEVEEEGEAAETTDGSTMVVVEVHPQAVKLEALCLPDDDDAAPPLASADPKDVDIVLFFVPAAATAGHEALVWVPNRHPGALLNLLPGDTGCGPRWGAGCAGAGAAGAAAALASSSAANSGDGDGDSRKRRRSSSSTRSSSSVRGREAVGATVAVAHSFLWLQWLSGASPFPARYLELGPALSSTCILDRLRARLRSQRQLDAFLDGLAKNPSAVPVDPALLAAGGPPALILGGGVGGVGGWEVVAFAEVPSLAGGDKDPFADPVCGVQTVAVARLSSAAAPDDKEARPPHDKAGSGFAAGGGAGAWERAGARVVELAVRKRGVGDIKLLAEVTPEYPLRPPRFCLSPAQTAGKPAFSNAYASVLLEVNAHFDDVLAAGGGAGPGREWLLPHQLRKLLFCLNAMELGAPAFGNTAGRMRWGKDRRRAVSVDVHARLLMPR